MRWYPTPLSNVGNAKQSSWSGLLCSKRTPQYSLENNNSKKKKRKKSSIVPIISAKRSAIFSLHSRFSWYFTITILLCYRHCYCKEVTISPWILSSILSRYVYNRKAARRWKWLHQTVSMSLPPPLYLADGYSRPKNMTYHSFV